MQVSLDEPGIELLGFLCRFRINAAYDTVVVNQLICHIARENTLGTVCHVYLALQFRTDRVNHITHLLCRSHR